MEANAKCERCGKEWKTQKTRPDRYCSMACRYDAREDEEESC